jgi:hypothetical protein
MSIDRDLERLLRGLTIYDDAQEPPGKDGDPQIAALLQFLQAQSDIVEPEDIILDIGSGKGILAHLMMSVWPDDASRPFYYAADQEAALERLSLPIPIHNHSMKVPLPALARLPDDALAPRVKAIIIRNVFHHLHIADTATMLLLLRAFASHGSTVYVQDMSSLPTFERHNTGWPEDIFRRLTRNFGFAVPGPFSRKSHSGIPWFALTLKDDPDAVIPNGSEAAHLVLEGRFEQLRGALDQRLNLTDADETAPKYVELSEQIAVLNSQIHAFEEGDGTAKPGLNIAGVALRPPSASEYVDEIRPTRHGASGLKAILSSKTLIDLPALIDTATTRLWFAGYSQRLLFALGPVRQALGHAIGRGVDARFLIVDPNSAAARARGRSEAYSGPDQLADDILKTVDGYRSFADEVASEMAAPGGGSAELRLCDTIFSSSFFFADTTCICSLYSFNTRGGSAPAFILRGSPDSQNDYFNLLLREFQTTWLKTPPLPS